MKYAAGMTFRSCPLLLFEVLQPQSPAVCWVLRFCGRKVPPCGLDFATPESQVPLYVAVVIFIQRTDPAHTA